MPIFINDLVAPHARIDYRESLYAFDHRLHNERQKRKLHAVAFKVLAFELVAELRRFGVVDFHK